MMRECFQKLTKIQVEGLREALDFLRNGYIERSSGNLGQIFYLILVHKSNGSRIRVYLYPTQLLIKRDGKVVKDVCQRYDGKFYDAQINSNLQIDICQSE